MTATDRKILQLARWLHEAYLDTDEGKKQKTPAWMKLTPLSRARYAALAERLLLSPPRVLTQAILAAEKVR
jgi:hypothetical protein